MVKIDDKRLMSPIDIELARDKAEAVLNDPTLCLEYVQVQRIAQLLDHIDVLQAEIEQQAEQVKHYKDARIKQNREIEQTLGKVLGFPWYKDDQRNFPGTTEANGVIVAPDVAETVAMQAAERIEWWSKRGKWYQKQIDERDARLQELEKTEKETEKGVKECGH